MKTVWDNVDKFEEIIAEYAGSKYAVSVDNCTDALFLCLKYLNASGKITINRAFFYITILCSLAFLILIQFNLLIQCDSFSFILICFDLLCMVVINFI